MRERVTTDQIKLARTVDLISYMQRYEPEELIRTGPHDYKTATHSSLARPKAGSAQTGDSDQGSTKKTG